jgi:signal transduction histidine kinase
MMPLTRSGREFFPLCLSRQFDRIVRPSERTSAPPDGLNGLATDRMQPNVNKRNRTLSDSTVAISKISQFRKIRAQEIAQEIWLFGAIAISTREDRLTKLRETTVALLRGAEGAYLTDVCKDLDDSMPSCEVNVSAEEGIEIRTYRAIPAVLLVNELITNAAKYAYPAGNCRVWVTLSRAPKDNVAISVRDEGVGLPPTFDIKSGRRLGMRLVDSFSQQLRGDLQIRRKDSGTEFVLTMPLRPSS